MIPVDQTKFGKPDGNCMEACIASILELGLDEIPVFAGHDDWYKVFQDFLARFDLEPLDIDIERSREIWVPTGYHIISGVGPRGLYHAVVGLNGKIVHDPNPDRDGLTKEETWTVFVARLLNRGELQC